ncbi:hypothetical protein [Noviherbaspirillum pedocola]|uniref:Uncharacterized protein n=1 Tax=Noviherbaspirillum pedocola TaxID=2801341 RepID=A0A934SUM9_9BURK|nr:hypothetical protein [Noviherbaspirillum pedocola]MBK4735486.1 hypothetical protein [Noviherbaspirillum pedocola]
MKTLMIKDLHVTHEPDYEAKPGIRPLSPEQLKLIHGGRTVSATVDGRPGGTVNDFDINMAIFEGRISGPYLL